MAASTIRVATDVGGTFTVLVCFETDLVREKFAQKVEQRFARF